jgi:hypothetical protein
MVKSINEIKDELLDNDYQLSNKTTKDLAWHLKNDENPRMAVVLATDAKLKELRPLIAKHLDHENGFVREVTIGCVLEGLELVEYAEKGFEMAQHDEDRVRNLALFTLGSIMDKIPFSLSKKIAQYLLEVFNNKQEDKTLRDSSYFSILKAMRVPWEKRPRVSRGVNPEEIDPSILEAFCQKYQILIG